jgi:transposase InsO family protein
MKFAFVLAEKAVWPVNVMCEVLGVSRSGYNAWQGHPASARDQEDGELVVAINAAHEVGRGNYGSPRVHRALRRKGTRVGEKHVARLMRREGIVAQRRKNIRITTDSKHTAPIAPNILNREFNIAAPNTHHRECRSSSAGTTR